MGRPDRGRKLPIVDRLLVGDCQAGRTSQRHDLDLRKSDFFAPASEVRAGEVESVAKLDEHVERHHQPEYILASGVVNHVFDNHECPTVGKGVVGRGDQVHLPLQIP